MRLTLKFILVFIFGMAALWASLSIYGCGHDSGVMIRHEVKTEFLDDQQRPVKTVTQTTEYGRSVWVNQNIEGLTVSRNPQSGEVEITLKGQSSESTALNSAVTVLGDIAKTGAAAAKLAK